MGLAEARRICTPWVLHEIGPDEEASIKRLCLSLYVETFNSKVIKRFRARTKKSLRVFEFRDSCVLRYVYMLPTFDVRFAHGHIRVYGYEIVTVRFIFPYTADIYFVLFLMSKIPTTLPSLLC